MLCTSSQPHGKASNPLLLGHFGVGCSLNVVFLLSCKLSLWGRANAASFVLVHVDDRKMKVSEVMKSDSKALKFTAGAWIQSQAGVGK